MSQYSGLKDRRILLVEDVELNQYLARHIMESWGCKVDVAEDGSKAVEMITAGEYDLVLMDIQMPVMDGMEATRLIRNMEDRRKAMIPIVALTANARHSECETYLKIGMNDWLSKPFEEPTLYQIVSKNIKKETTMNTIPVSTEGKTASAAVVDMNTKLYNMAMVEAISGGDTSFIIKMMQLFLDTVPATLNDLQATAEQGEWLMLSKHAHKLKSTIDSMGIVTLKQDIRDIESGGKTGAEPDRLRSLVGRVLEVMQVVMEQVRKAL